MEPLVYTMGLFMSPVTSQRPSVYRRSSYGTLGVIGLCWSVLWRSVLVIGLSVIGAVVLMVALGVIEISDLPRILKNLWTGSGGTGSRL